MLIQNVTHEYLFAAVSASVFAGVIFYHIYMIILRYFRQKKLKDAMSMIQTGYSELCREGGIIPAQEITVNNNDIKTVEKADTESTLHSDKKAGKVSRKPGKSKRNEKKNTGNGVIDTGFDVKAATKESRKERRKEKADAKEEAVLMSLNELYNQSDLFDSAIDLYYTMKVPGITDENVKDGIRFAKKKRTSKPRKNPKYNK